MARAAYIRALPLPPPAGAELAEFEIAIVPAALGALETRIAKYAWAPNDYAPAVQHIRRLQLSMLGGGLAELLESNRQIYRLLDTSLNGVEYVATGAEPVEVLPAIPAAPTPPAAPGGLLGMVDQLPGTLDIGWFGIGGHKATIADVVAALRVGDAASAESLSDKLQAILDSASSAANIGQLVTDTFLGAVEAGEEGGIMVLLAASIVGNLAATSALGMSITQLALRVDRLISSVDGGGTPPEDSLLEALRGIIPAGENRNVIDASGGAATIEKLDAMIAELQAIRGQLA